MRPKLITISPYATADADIIAASQTPAAGGIQSLSLIGGGTVTLDYPRQVVFAFAASEVGRTFLVEGTSPNGGYRVEAVAGTAAAASTVQQFATVTSIKVDDDTAGAVQVGTATAVDGDWIPVNWRAQQFNLTVAFTGITAATNADFTLQYTLSNIYRTRAEKQAIASPWDLIFPTVNAFDHDTFADETTDGVGVIISPVTGIRWQSNAVFTGGDVTMEIVQSEGCP